jgi:hypothetical protein
MALLVVGSVAAMAGTAAYISKKNKRSRYHTFIGDEDPRFDFDEAANPERVKALTKYYSIDFPDILVGWKVRISDGRVGTVVNSRRRFMRATIFDIQFEGKTSLDSVVLNRKNKSNRRKYLDFGLISKEF